MSVDDSTCLYKALISNINDSAPGDDRDLCNQLVFTVRTEDFYNDESI
jgi:hypothetical protein